MVNIIYLFHVILQRYKQKVSQIRNEKERLENDLSDLGKNKGDAKVYEYFLYFVATILHAKNIVDSTYVEPVFHLRICSREQRKKQLDWLVTNTDDITTQSHSLFACSREKNRKVENGVSRNTCRLPSNIDLHAPPPPLFNNEAYE